VFENILGKKHRIALIAVLLVLLACISYSQVQETQPLVTFTVNEAGVTKVDYIVSTEGNLSVTIWLLGTPDPSLGIVVVDEKGLPLAYGIDEAKKTLTVATLNSSQVYVTYYAHDLTSKSGIFWILSVNSPYKLKILLPVTLRPST